MIHDGFFLYEGGGAFGEQCAELLARAGLARWPRPDGTLVAIAPRLSRRLAAVEYSLPLYGTLIFHPSILPYHRGPDAVRWAALLREAVSGVTWFWCDNGLDTGPICEQEAVLLDLAKSAGRNYWERLVPAGLRALARAAEGVKAASPRCEPQEEQLATFEGMVRAPGIICPHCGRHTAPLNWHERGDCEGECFP